MKFCPACGQPVELKIPEGDHLPRHVCTACGTIHYQNPRIIAGCVIEVEGQNPAVQARHRAAARLLDVPAGFMENGETVQQAAAREARRKRLAHVRIGSLLAVVNVLRAHQVHVMFRAGLPSREFGIGPESLETRLYDERKFRGVRLPS